MLMQHTRQHGIDVINELESLGTALGYKVQREHRVGRTAAVDLSWTAADFNDVPLFIFEVESTASTGIASNALKIYGRDSDELVKPLFFFHLVLAGSPENERIANAQREWGRHNYKLYRFNESDQRAALVGDILRQHRRVRNELELLEMVKVLSSPTWGGRNLAQKMLILAQELRFDASFLHAYACLSIQDRSFQADYARRLRTRRNRSQVESEMGSDDEAGNERDTYRGGPGDYLPGMIETAIRIYANDVLDAHGPAVFELWAAGSYGLRMIDANFGLSRDYDGFVIGMAPIQYALVGALLTDFPLSRDWVIRDLARLIERERDRGLRPDMRLPAVLWLVHLLAATITGVNSGLADEEIESLFDDLTRHVDEAGGVPLASLMNPPGAFSDFDDDSLAWLKTSERIPLPGLSLLREQQERQQLAHSHDDNRRPISTDAFCFLALVDDRAYARPSWELLSRIYKNSS